MVDFAEFFKLRNHLQVSIAESKGDVRPQMEDRITMGHFQMDKKMIYAFAVCDGHCSIRKDPELSMVGHVARNLLGFLQTNMSKFGILHAINATFSDLKNTMPNETSGTTVSLVVLIYTFPDFPEIYIANVGDSTVFGVSNDLIRKLSVDHKPENPSEVKRIIKKFGGVKIEDGYVVNANGDQLGMTRALGDCDFQNIISTEPTIKHVKSSDVIIIASDGIWDVLSGEEVWNFVKSRPVQTAAYDTLAMRNSQFSQHDNCAIIIIDMR